MRRLRARLSARLLEDSTLRLISQIFSFACSMVSFSSSAVTRITIMTFSPKAGQILPSFPGALILFFRGTLLAGKNGGTHYVPSHASVKLPGEKK